MCEHTLVTNGQFPILIPFDSKLDSLTVFNFKGDMVGMTVMMVAIAVMVVGLSSHIYNRCRHCQHRRILIFNELTDILCNNPEEQDNPYN